MKLIIATINIIFTNTQDEGVRNAINQVKPEPDEEWDETHVAKLLCDLAGQVHLGRELARDLGDIIYALHYSKAQT